MEIFTKDIYKEYLKKNIQDKTNAEFARIAGELETEAEIRMKNPLYSVTFSESRAKSGDPHDYYSEAPYWWPDPNNPGGRFIRRDGEFYPDRMINHMLDMKAMVDDVYILTVAAYFFDRADFAKRADKLLRTWFLDEETKMNPNLNHAQAIFGVSDGRGIGIIDTVKLIPLISAMDYFTEIPGTADTVNGLKAWFSDYLTWLDTSKNGIDEREYFNNHGNWWNSQAAAYAVFTGNDKMRDFCFDRLINKIIPEQTGTDGSFTDELTRTRSYTYTLYNLEACSVTAEVAHNCGVDLWNKPCKDGKSIAKSLDFMLEHYKNPTLWTHEQIGLENLSPKHSYQLASVRIDGKYKEAHDIRKSNMRYFAEVGHMGCPCLLEGYF